jgi:hypothetical protein
MQEARNGDSHREAFFLSAGAVICRELRTILDGHEIHFDGLHFDGLRIDVLWIGIAGSGNRLRVRASRSTCTEAGCNGPGWNR